MITTVQVCTIEIPVFQDMGIAVESKWTSLDTASKPVREFLASYAGRFVRVHPIDIERLAELGFKAEGGKLVDTRATAAKAKAPKA